MRPARRLAVGIPMLVVASDPLAAGPTWLAHNTVALSQRVHGGLPRTSGRLRKGSAVRTWRLTFTHIHAAVRLPVLAWVPLWMVNHVERQIDIQIRPVHVIRAMSLDMRDLTDRGVGEPREFVEGHIVLLPVDIEPEPSCVNMGDLNY